ncbi:hypothetical protein R1sor_006135 [Riccia sorocarpa]|uniref:Protein tweety homolog n=1 Tax=Riccia sorocarpa TaxID=122646 RepID=A0ABD3HPW5_9MARC
MDLFAGKAETSFTRLFLALLLASTSVLAFRPENYESKSASESNIKNLDDQLPYGEYTNPANYWSGHRRFLLQESGNGTGGGSDGRPLAVKDGRLDPFDDFHKYRGGYDVESKHYWGSVVFTGIFGYALAAFFLLLGVILGCSSLCTRHCSKREPRRALIHEARSRPVSYCSCELVAFIVTLLAAVALAACIALYVGNRNFSMEARDAKRTLSGTADNATNTIGNITAAITRALQLLEPYESSDSTREIANAKTRLSNDSESIQRTVDDKVGIFNKIITAMEAALIVITTLNLIFIILGTVFAVWSRKGIFAFIVVVSWILAVLSSFLFGLYFAFNNVVEDTCDAINEYRRQPYNTTLDALLPCEDLLSARDSVLDIAKDTRDSLISVNNTLNSVNPLLGNTLKPLCEQIGPPPDYQYIDSCPNTTVTVGDLPKELEPFRCTSNDSVSCTQQKKYLTASEYEKVIAYATSAQILLGSYPRVNALTDCSLIVNTFTEISENNCGPLNSALRLLWISFLLVALSMICIILSWLALYYPSKKRKSRRMVAPQEIEIPEQSLQTK